MLTLRSTRYNSLNLVQLMELYPFPAALNIFLTGYEHDFRNQFVLLKYFQRMNDDWFTLQ
ncbi:hypothetical protein D3C79_1054880 [compost metagenome]